MKIAIILPVFMLLFAGSLEAQNVWTFDKAHSNIKFVVTHMVISEVDGYFTSYDGKITTRGDDFQNASVEFSVDVASINTENQKRDDHLRSDDFFNAEKFPKMTFKSTSMKKTGNNKYVLEGDLTIRDKTKRVTLDVVHSGTVEAWGSTKAGFKITGTINRFDFDLKWNNLLEVGGAVVGRNVRLDLNVQLQKQA